MTYRTHSFPHYESLTPEVADAEPAFVQEAASILKDIFGEYQDIDRPEYDAPGFAKSKVVRAARTVYHRTENQTLGEVCAFTPGTGLADERGVPHLEVTPEVLAVAGYAETVRGLEWGAAELGPEWDTNAFVLVHDNLHDLQALDEHSLVVVMDAYKGDWTPFAVLPDEAEAARLRAKLAEDADAACETPWYYADKSAVRDGEYEAPPELESGDEVHVAWTGATATAISTNDSAARESQCQHDGLRSAVTVYDTAAKAEEAHPDAFNISDDHNHDQ